jgi:hypothetical protein
MPPKNFGPAEAPTSKPAQELIKAAKLDVLEHTDLPHNFQHAGDVAAGIVARIAKRHGLPIATARVVQESGPSAMRAAE